MSIVSDAPNRDDEPKDLMARQDAAWLGLVLAATVLTQRLDTALGRKPTQMDVRDYQILRSLAADDRGVTITTLAAAVNSTNQALNMRLKGLSARDLATSAPDPHDGRMRRAYITEQGQDILRQAQEVITAHVHQHLGMTLDSERVDALAQDTAALLREMYAEDEWPLLILPPPNKDRVH